MVGGLNVEPSFVTQVFERFGTRQKWPIKSIGYRFLGGLTSNTTRLSGLGFDPTGCPDPGGRDPVDTNERRYPATARICCWESLPAQAGIIVPDFPLWMVGLYLRIGRVWRPETHNTLGVGTMASCAIPSRRWPRPTAGGVWWGWLIDLADSSGNQIRSTS
jgi:hypothetical protein